MSRHIGALILAAALTAAWSYGGDARVVHPILNESGGGGDDGGRRLFGPLGCGECAALCQQVHYKTLCTTMTTLPGVNTPVQLLDTALRITAVKAAMAEMKLDEAIRSSAGQGTAMTSSLDSCKESYASLVDSLQSTRKTLNSGGSSADIMSELSAAGTFSTDCEDIFDERPELQSPIPGAQRHVSRLVSNCLDLAATIEKQP
ncbi:hypothetical protein QOZ80_1AG0030190 [Eleusine coracana subsp. coracana]|nr:hypothetical protein QOZ80_1AG0030190 [Eleusine coracana subsp. coracana]